MRPTLTSRERVLMALAHQEADRVPIDFGGTGVTSICYQAYDDLRAYLGLPPNGFKPEDLGSGASFGVVLPHEDVCARLRSDVQQAAIGDPDSWCLTLTHTPEYDSYVDEWGAGAFRPVGGHYFDFRTYPIKEATVSAVRAWQAWPDPQDPGRWRGLRQRCLDALSTGRTLAVSSALGGGIFEQPAWIMPMEAYYMGLATDPAFADAILGKMFDLYYEVTARLLAEVGDLLDVWVYWDDLSGQRGPLISPIWYDRHLGPLHRRLFDLVKSRSHAKVFLHSCGAVRPWISRLIDVGVDILNPVQISASDMDLAALKRDFGRDIVFWGAAVNPQDTLVFGSPEQVAAEARRNLEALASHGGFIFAPVHNIQNGVPPANVVAMFDTCFEYGVFGS